MKLRVIPSPRLVLVVTAAGTAAAVALLFGVNLELVSRASTGFAAALVLVACGDFLLTRRAWHAAQVRMLRALPSAFAIGDHIAVEVLRRLS